jgi:hypothetical protein
MGGFLNHSWIEKVAEFMINMLLIYFLSEIMIFAVAPLAV